MSPRCHDAERIATDPDFPRLLAAARERRALMAHLAARHRDMKISQAEVARPMATSQAFVSRFESGEVMSGPVFAVLAAAILLVSAPRFFRRDASRLR